MSYIDTDNLDHSPDLAIALGNLLVAWAYAEGAICAALARVSGMNINMATMGYYRVGTFEARIKFTRALLMEWTSAKYDKAAIDDELAKLNNLSKTRNDWVHGVRSVDKKTETETVIFDFRRPEDAGRKRPVKAADVNNHLRAVRQRATRLLTLIDRNSMFGKQPDA